MKAFNKLRRPNMVGVNPLVLGLGKILPRYEVLEIPPIFTGIQNTADLKMLFPLNH